MTTSTPATRAGLSIGDVVIVGRGEACPHDFLVGATATFKRDDHSQSPLFEQHGRTQYLDLREITIQPKAATPAAKAGIKVGDEVVVTPGMLADYFTGPVMLIRDDGSEMPRFGDNTGKELWLALTDVSKKPSGPRAGVLWTAAPKGATHYSLDSTYIEPWHKQNEDGSFAFKSADGFTTYPLRSQNVVLDKMIPVPGVVTKQNLMLVQEEMRLALLEVDKAKEAVVAKEQVVTDKLGVITAAGYTILGSRLVKAVASSEWQEGDQVRCITTRGAGLADLTVGKVYTVARTGSLVRVIDDLGDKMQGCVEAGCFEFVSAAPVRKLDLNDPSNWKAGDIVRCIDRENAGAANIIIGGRYRVVIECGLPHIVDGDGDNMRGCVRNGCFEMHRQA